MNYIIIFLSLLGLTSLTVAGFLIYLPIGFLVAGLCLLFIAWDLRRSVDGTAAGPG